MNSTRGMETQINCVWSVDIEIKGKIITAAGVDIG